MNMSFTYEVTKSGPYDDLFVCVFCFVLLEVLFLWSEGRTEGRKKGSRRKIK